MQLSTARRRCSKYTERTSFYIRRQLHTPYGNGKVENGIGLIKTLTRTMLISSGLTKNHWYMAARYATYIANKISMCPSKKHTVWQEYYKEKPNILTLAQNIDHSFRPRSLTGIYLGKDTIHGILEKHIIVTSTQNGTPLYQRYKRHF